MHLIQRSDVYEDVIDLYQERDIVGLCPIFYFIQRRMRFRVNMSDSSPAHRNLQSDDL